MRAWRLILLSLCLAPLAVAASEYPLIDPYPEGGAGEGVAVRLTRSIYKVLLGVAIGILIWGFVRDSG